MPRLAPLAVGLLAVAAAAAGAATGAGELDRLAALAPGLSPGVLDRALTAVACAPDPEVREARVLAVIDYSLPSTTPRLWVFDRDEPRLLFHALVAHGSGSGANYATRFSNRHGTRQSSLGLFLAGGTYHGRNGYSLHLDGLDPGVNDRARARAIVMHGAWYVNAAFAKRHGRLGRSWGCPALERSVAPLVIDTLKGGGVLYVSAEEPEWLAHEAQRCSALAAPGGAPVAGAERPRPGSSGIPGGGLDPRPGSGSFWRR